jgi:streptogramin lyase
MTKVISVSGIRRPSRTVLLLAALVIVSGALGTVDALRGASHEPPRSVLQRASISGAQAAPGDLVIGRPGITLVQAPDPAVEFPVQLQDLPAAPYRLAVDAATGDLWFVLFTGDDGQNRLYRYSTKSPVIEQFTVPASNGTGLFSAIVVDERGHVIWAEGQHIVDFDPVAKTYAEVQLQASAFQRQMGGPDGVWVSDMAIAGRFAYVSRMNVAAITEVDLGSGGTREIPYPEEFGPVYELAAADASVLLSNPFDSPGGKARTAILSTSSSAFTPVDAAVSAVQANGNGGFVALDTAVPGLLQLGKDGLSLGRWERLTNPAEAGSAIGAPLTDALAVNRLDGSIWFTGEGRHRITRHNPDVNSMRDYNLPVYLTASHRCPLPRVGAVDECPEPVEFPPAVRGMAVAPSGDLYFADAAFNRIGVIRASQ